MRGRAELKSLQRHAFIYNRVVFVRDRNENIRLSIASSLHTLSQKYFPLIGQQRFFIEESLIKKSLQTKYTDLQHCLILILIFE